MKILRYVLDGNTVEMDWNAVNETIAAREADGGVYEITDDGQPTTEAQPTEAERIAELELALQMLLSGVTE